MPDFPITFAGRSIPSPAALREALREDAHRGPYRMQDAHIADVWLEAMAAEPVARVVGQALVDLVRTDDDPAVLALAGFLGARTTGFPEAAARRIVDGPPVPDGPGMSFATVAEDLRFRARAVDDPALLARLAAGGTPLDVLRLQLDDPDAALVDALAAAASNDVPVAVISRAALVVAREQPERLLDAARAVRALSEEHRAAFLEYATRAAPDQRAALEAALG